MTRLGELLSRELPATPFGEKIAAAIERRIVEEICKLFDDAAAAARAEGTAAAPAPLDVTPYLLLGYIRGGLHYFIGEHVQLGCAPETWSSLTKEVR